MTDQMQNMFPAAFIVTVTKTWTVTRGQIQGLNIKVVIKVIKYVMISLVMSRFFVFVFISHKIMSTTYLESDVTD